MLGQSLWTKINYGQNIGNVQKSIMSVVDAVYARLIAMNKKSLRKAGLDETLRKTGEIVEKAA
jgi:hypothetical protein